MQNIRYVESALRAFFVIPILNAYEFININFEILNR